MGTGKKEKARKEKQGNVGDGMNNVKIKGENFYRCVLNNNSIGDHADNAVARRRRRRH